MKNRWAMLLAVLLIPVWATAQNAANSSFQIKGVSYSILLLKKASRTLQSK